MTKKSLFVTYMLWLFGGVFGFHHFYLGRDFHALTWWMFAGGYFGLGLIRDLWRIPEYVKDANEESSYMEKLAEKMQKCSSPPSGAIRYFGQITVADAFGYLVLGAIPRELIPDKYHATLGALLVPFGVALGAYMVGNIGRHQGSLVNALIGAYLTAPGFLILDSPISLTSLVCCSYFNHYKTWRRTPRPYRSVTHRIAVLSFCGFIYLSLWSSWLYFNCTISSQDQHQEPVKCREAAKHFFKSPIWKEFVNVMKEMWKCFQEQGWKEVWRQLYEAFDPVGEANALRVLGLNASATQQEITSRYRQLSREWHPDKHKEAEEKQIAQERFIEIQQAYEILSKIKSHRVAQNVRNPVVEENYDHEEL